MQKWTRAVVQMRLLFLAIIPSLGMNTLARGISKQKPLYEWRVFDSPIAGIPCKVPTGNGQRNWDDPDDCVMLFKTSKETMRQVAPAKRLALEKQPKACKPPDVVNSLPDRLRSRILAIWEERDPKGDCFQQQRRTRLILLNLPPSLRKAIRPKALQCSLPHFIDRLEWDLQVQLRRLWAGYKKGEPWWQSSFIFSNSTTSPVESFDMPPATLFRRYQLFQKLKRSNAA
ncbi:hypothetical protein COOONC_00971 [Cooperia oncophora]